MSRPHMMLFRYDHEIRQALEAIKEHDGVSFHEQIRRAVLLWIAEKNPVIPRTSATADRQAALAARVMRMALTEEPSEDVPDHERAALREK